MDTRAVEVRITGVVQGVGFRPFVHRLALRYMLSGWVRNEGGEVRLRIRGTARAVERFLSSLKEEAPPLTRLEEVRVSEIPPDAEMPEDGVFQVKDSAGEEGGRALVPPDVSICPQCLQELQDAGDRRYGYPFTTCTDCGPRFTIIRKLPYDRVRTTMDAFEQCPACLAEFRDPSHRRYHSQTNSCPACGPRIWYEGPGEDGPPLERAVALLLQGGTLALKGLGGFHLVVDATSPKAVRRLRHRKGREAKPFAIMCRDLVTARRLAHMSAAEEALLDSPEKPIVLLREREESGLAPEVSPDLDTVGTMLSYTPLHHLLLSAVGRPLVMTSGNPSEEPIVAQNDVARERLSTMADGFLLHDREVLAPCDDSVIRVIEGRPLFLRRARGFAPLPLPLPRPAPIPILAVGPHLKNTFALARDGEAFVSQHMGDLDTLEGRERFLASVEHLKSALRVEPQAVVRDLHPGYLSSDLARELAEAGGYPQPLTVQHHHAHVAAVAAEHGITEPVLGLAFDGTGYGEDGHVWGGEFLVADLTGFRRVGQLRYAPLPGGERAIRLPWRAALGYLSLDPEEEASFSLAFQGVDAEERAVAEGQIQRAFNAPLASSVGRLFDAAAAVMGVCRENRYEGQAAMKLEALAREGLESLGSGTDPLPFPALKDEGGIHVLNPLPLLAGAGRRALKGRPVTELAAAFHEALALSSVSVAAEICAQEGLKKVVLGGGVFQNALLTSRVRALLEEGGLEALTSRRLSPNDGCISYGQAAVAAARLQKGV